MYTFVLRSLDSVFQFFSSVLIPSRTNVENYTEIVSGLELKICFFDRDILAYN